MNQEYPPGMEDPLWYKDAIIYQLHVRSFLDSDDDGIGDFPGLIDRLDYLENLGVNALWLLPFYPSPLKDDGYDISDYAGIHPSYGTIEDFNRFIREAHRRGIRVITELVINHTSDQHPWFQRARRAAEGSVERDFYVWSHDINKYKGARIIFKDFELSNWSADPVAGSYYWHRFYHHQPDLNFDNPEVRQAIFRILDYWLKKGVDGLRLDAVPYLYEREATSCENLPETHEFLKSLRSHIDARYKNRMVIAEANQWPEDAAAYFGRGDESHMVFHFPIMPRLFMAIKMENRFPVTDIMSQTPPIPDTAQWAMFLRNHDELTLEMVTDRERDYMYQAYARDRAMRINLGIRRRLAPLLGHDRRAMELLNSLLFAMPGTPVIYYGDEIGMGDNIFLGDRGGMRTPMQWGPDRNAGFSRANTQRLFLPVVTDPEYHYESINVETQLNNPRSFLWWMKRAIRVRKQYKAFGRGAISFLKPANPHVLAFTRSWGAERLLIVTNLSRFAQSVQLDLPEFSGAAPVELFGRSPFPDVTAAPWPMTLDPYAYYWFSLEPKALPQAAAQAETPLPSISVKGSWENVFSRDASPPLINLLPAWLRMQPWFAAKNRVFTVAGIKDDLRVALDSRACRVMLVEIEYADSTHETFLLSFAFAEGEQAEKVRALPPFVPLAEVKIKGKPGGMVFDGFWDGEFAARILKSMLLSRPVRGDRGSMAASLLPETAGEIRPSEDLPPPRTSQPQGPQTYIFFGDKLVLKLFRRLDPEKNPDAEISRFLSENSRFPNTPAFVSSLDYSSRGFEPQTLAVLHRYVENLGSGWQHALDHLDRYFELAVAKARDVKDIPPGPAPLPGLLNEEPPALAAELFGDFLQEASLLGKRTAEMHAALALPAEQTIAMEEFSFFAQQSLYQSIRGLATSTFRVLRTRLADLSPAPLPQWRRVLDMEPAVIGRLVPFKDQRIGSMRIRIHGNFNLTRVLFTGKDFYLFGFEGESERSFSERRAKSSAIYDLASMVRSFHYISHAALLRRQAGPSAAPGDAPEPWRKFWYAWSAASFLKGYCDACRGAPFFPANPREFSDLWNIFILQKSLYELSYELANRPDWINIAIEGILEIMGT